MTAEISEHPTKSRRRSWLFRFMAVLFGCSLVLLLEATLWLVGLGKIEDPGDPFLGFSETVPLFELHEPSNRYIIPASRQVFFQPDSFGAKKESNEFRIFCLGGSTVQGRPYSIETSFTTWLELELRAADPATKWEVVNCGGVSYASYRLLPILKETLDYQPDLFIIYTGHNEFLEERTYSGIKNRPRWLAKLQDKLYQSRIYCTAWQLLGRQEKAADVVDLPAEVDALLDYQGGLAKYHRDDAWRDDVVSHYSYNLLRMTHIARAANVPILFVNPVSNLRDTPPFKVELNDELTDTQRADFLERWEAAKNASWEDLQTKATLTQAALELDNRHADAHFLLAKVYDAMGDAEHAKQEYLRAKDEDICPLRMLESMHSELQRVAEQTNTRLVDARQFFELRAGLRIPGDDLLIDHVHPRIEQHQQLASLLFAELKKDGIVTVEDGWEDRRRKLVELNFASLPENYFPESVERLRGLQKWAEGRVTRLKPDSAVPSATPSAMDEER